MANHVCWVCSATWKNGSCSFDQKNNRCHNQSDCYLRLADLMHSMYGHIRTFGR
jgi:hypothetical protein